ncbi:MAG: ATP-binding protein [Balneolaceae bacterium]|nr:ATP-binding protein [Balneolaceae bacterium]
MSFKLSKRWIEDKKLVTNLIQRVFDETGESEKFVHKIDKGVTLFEEGDVLNDIYILLDGVVELYKKKPHTGVNFPVIRLEYGSLIGIIAFTTGKPSLTTAITSEPSTVLKIPEPEIRLLLKRDERMKEYIDEIILANLSERFKSNISLQIKLDSVNNKLREERNELKKAYQELKEAQDRLIYQEKMATLGQLVAGFAHEVNNPTASLLRSTETLEDRISELINRGDQDPENQEFVRKIYEAGKKSGYPDTATLRERSRELRAYFPEVKASQLRLLAQLPADLVPDFQSEKITNTDDLEFYLHYFELGKMFQNIESAGNRISGLVKSLKSYSRTDTDQQWELIDIREGIHDTLQLTSNRIKYYDIQIHLDEVPKIRANPAALNQVWTNIILNAADSMGKNGSLVIECNSDHEQIQVTIRDSGPGIPEEIIDKIFDSNFSTKKSDLKFGLGLGLSISKDIIQQHGGTISAENAPEGGAVFTVILPVE